MMAQEQGVEIAGLVEDMARMYPKSLREADLTDLETQFRKTSGISSATVVNSVVTWNG